MQVPCCMGTCFLRSIHSCCGCDWTAGSCNCISSHCRASADQHNGMEIVAAAHTDYKKLKTLIGINPTLVNFTDTSTFSKLIASDYSHFGLKDHLLLSTNNTISLQPRFTFEKRPAGFTFTWGCYSDKLTPLHFICLTVVHYYLQSLDQESGNVYGSFNNLDFTSVKESMELLLQKGANVCAKDWRGNTPLHYVALTGNVALAELILHYDKSGSVLKIINNYNDTPFQVAGKYKHAAMQKLLTSYANSEGGEVEPKYSDCVICKNKKKTHGLFPCAHLCVCVDCSKNLKICPICRENVQQIIRIYEA